jgi:hypothetical protein
MKIQGTVLKTCNEMKAVLYQDSIRLLADSTFMTLCSYQVMFNPTYSEQYAITVNAKRK